MPGRFVDVEHLKRPTRMERSFLHSWLDGNEEGRSLLQDREVDTWSLDNDFHLVTLDSKLRTRSTFSQWLEPHFVDFYHYIWGGCAAVGCEASYSHA